MGNNSVTVNTVHPFKIRADAPDADLIVEAEISAPSADEGIVSFESRLGDNVFWSLSTLDVDVDDDRAGVGTAVRTPFKGKEKQREKRPTLHTNSGDVFAIQLHVLKAKRCINCKINTRHDKNNVENSTSVSVGRISH